MNLLASWASWASPAVLLLALAPIGCSHAASSSSASTGDAGPPSDAGSGGSGGAGGGTTTAFVPASHPAPPTVDKGPGKVLKAPKVVVVTFGAEPLAAQLATFASSIGKSTHWAATTAEYGVGAVTAGTAVPVMTAPATIEQADLESWLVSQLDGTHPEWGTPDPSSIYTLVYPLGTTVTINGQSMCSSSPAYHNEVTLGSNVNVPYAVIARCDPFLGLSGIDFLTAGLSHEWVEASTNPFPQSDPAYGGLNGKYNDWTLTTGGELADMCTLTGKYPYYKPADLPFTVQRSWSNAAATAGHDPCVSAPAGAYFNAVPVLPDTISGTYSGQGFTSEGLKVGIGKSAVVTVELFSDAPTSGPWTVEAIDAIGGLQMPSLSFSWDRTQGQNGDKLSLTITRLSNAPGLTGVNPFIVYSTLGTEQNAWVGAVGD